VVDPPIGHVAGTHTAPEAAIAIVPMLHFAAAPALAVRLGLPARGMGVTQLVAQWGLLRGILPGSRSAGVRPRAPRNRYPADVCLDADSELQHTGE
jgi:hypothetical protein